MEKIKNETMLVSESNINEKEIPNSSKSLFMSIKSIYIVKHIFSFLRDTTKLNMIIYNKNFQKKFEIDIEDYKKLKGRYKVGEKNGEAKEYDLYKDILLFEGQYLEGKRNGNGKITSMVI